MQIGDDQELFVRPIERARGISETASMLANCDRVIRSSPRQRVPGSWQFRLARG